MEKTIKLKGIIKFDPFDITKKHKNQSSWKKTAMIQFYNDDICLYYSWFIKKRYNLILNKPLRGSHISFINDSLRDMGKGLEYESEIDIINNWNIVKSKWNNKEIEIVLNPDICSDGLFWWMKIIEKENTITSIRAEVGLSKPYWGLHLTIGYANERYVEHSKYIVNLLTKYGGEFN